MPPRQRRGFAGQRFELRVRLRIEQRGEAAHERGARRWIGEVGHCEETSNIERRTSNIDLRWRA
jgi:hypothetical protein